MVIGNKRYSHVNIAQKHETIWQNIGGGHFRYVVPNQIIWRGMSPSSPSGLGAHKHAI